MIKIIANAPLVWSLESKRLRDNVLREREGRLLPGADAIKCSSCLVVPRFTEQRQNLTYSRPTVHLRVRPLHVFLNQAVRSSPPYLRTRAGLPEGMTRGWIGFQDGKGCEECAQYSVDRARSAPLSNFLPHLPVLPCSSAMQPIYLVSIEPSNSLRCLAPDSRLRTWSCSRPGVLNPQLAGTVYRKLPKKPMPAHITPLR
jgi:hypothetical protein